MLEHGLGQPDAAARLGEAIDRALELAPTPDLGGEATTAEVGDAVLASLTAR
jgi:isocitrate/isopropylmalate dehydrogenase